MYEAISKLCNGLVAIIGHQQLSENVGLNCVLQSHVNIVNSTGDKGK